MSRVLWKANDRALIDVMVASDEDPSQERLSIRPLDSHGQVASMTVQASEVLISPDALFHLSELDPGAYLPGIGMEGRDDQVWLPLPLPAPVVSSMILAMSKVWPDAVLGDPATRPGNWLVIQRRPDPRPPIDFGLTR